MQPFPQIPNVLDKLALDERVHIFVGSGDECRLAPASLENLIQRGRHLLGFRFVEDPDSGEPLDPRQAAGHVVFEETPIEAKGGPELKRDGIGLAAETS